LSENPKNLVGYCGLYCGACGIHQGKIKQAGFVKMFGECPGCLTGGGPPDCAIRECCKPKAYSTCVECVETETCEKLQEYGPQAIERLQKIKAMGVDKWTEEIQRKVEAGYCYLDERT
jgi:hypothetical protein